MKTITALTLAAALWAAAPQTASAQLTVDGTEFVLRMADGRTLRSADLVGATLLMGAGSEQTAVTIESVEEDPQSIGGDVFLHHLVVKDDGGSPKEFRSPDAQGRSLGFQCLMGTAASNLLARVAPSASAFAGAIVCGRKSRAALRFARCTKPASTWRAPTTEVTALLTHAMAR